MKIKFQPPHQDDFIRALIAWPVLLVALLLGAGLGALFHAVFPPPFRAEASVVVDNNLEKSLPTAPDRDVFYFLARETDKLEALAWSDSVLGAVSKADDRLTVAELRQGVLELSQPSDGTWHFYAVAADPKQAATLASTWAESFTRTTREAVDTAVKLDAAQTALKNLTNAEQACATDCRSYLDAISELEKQIAGLEESSLGINPNVQIAATQIAAVPVARISSLGNAMLAGSAAGLLLVFLGLLLFIPRAEEKD